MKTQKKILEALTIILVLLWCPVLVDKMINVETYRTGISRQPLPDLIKQLLIYVLPIVESVTLILLTIQRYRTYGFLLSSILMLGFTGYITAALLGVWQNLPCSCGSVITGMNWTQHFWFNLFFLLISVSGFILNRTKNRHSKSE